MKEAMVTADSKPYWKTVSQIPWHQRGEIRTKLVPWVYTNDHNFADVMPRLVESVCAQKRNGRFRIAVLSGVGSILNIAPHVDVDLFVSVDRNSFVLDQVRKMVENVQDAQTPWEYLRVAQLKTFFRDLKEMHADPRPYWNMERDSFGSWHFLASPENYRKTKDVIKKTPVFYSQGNFAHAPYVKALGDAFAGASITYASFTDLAEWSPEFFDVVHFLPLAADAVIAWSTNKGNEGRPIAQISVGLDEYVQSAKTAAAGLSVDYFLPHV